MTPIYNAFQSKIFWFRLVSVSAESFGQFQFRFRYRSLNQKGGFGRTLCCSRFIKVRSEIELVLEQNSQTIMIQVLLCFIFYYKRRYTTSQKNLPNCECCCPLLQKKISVVYGDGYLNCLMETALFQFCQPALACSGFF